jgi:hypothetical protein
MVYKVQKPSGSECYTPPSEPFGFLEISCAVQNFVFLVRKPEGRKLLERSRHRWVDNIKMDLGDMMGWHGSG